MYMEKIYLTKTCVSVFHLLSFESDVLIITEWHVVTFYTSKNFPISYHQVQVCCWLDVFRLINNKPTCKPVLNTFITLEWLFRLTSIGKLIISRQKTDIKLILNAMSETVSKEKDNFRQLPSFFPSHHALKIIIFGKHQHRRRCLTWFTLNFCNLLSFLLQLASANLLRLNKSNKPRKMNLLWYLLIISIKLLWNTADY